jgi:hypothetical protein
MSKKHGIEDIKKIFLSNGVELLDDIYISSRHPLRFKCNCGNEHKVSVDNLKRGKKRCPTCFRAKRANSRLLSLKEIEDFILSKGYKIISLNGYRKVTDKITILCPKGHTVFVTYRSFKLNEGGCRQCYFKRNVGENHHAFKHGRSKEDRMNRNICRIDHNKWKRQLLIRFDYSCVICGQRGGKKICAHHLNGYNWDIQNRYNLDNGIILCKSHHDEFHKIYKKGNNTHEQLIEYVQGLRKARNPWNKLYFCD